MGPVAPSQCTGAGVHSTIQVYTHLLITLLSGVGRAGGEGGEDEKELNNILIKVKK